LEATVHLLEELGHELVQAAPQIDREAFAIAFLTMIAAETRDEMIGRWPGRAQSVFCRFRDRHQRAGSDRPGLERGRLRQSIELLDGPARGWVAFFKIMTFC